VKRWKCIVIILVMLLLVACSGQRVRHVGPAPSEQVVSETESLDLEEGEDVVQGGTEYERTTSPTDVTEVPPESTTGVTGGTEQVSSQLESAESDPAVKLVVIESENAYTDSEKEKILEEIDHLLDETLLDLSVDEALDIWDETEGGGQ